MESSLLLGHLSKSVEIELDIESSIVNFTTLDNGESQIES